MAQVCHWKYNRSGCYPESTDEQYSGLLHFSFEHRIGDVEIDAQKRMKPEATELSGVERPSHKQDEWQTDLD